MDMNCIYSISVNFDYIKNTLALLFNLLFIRESRIH